MKLCEAVDGWRGWCAMPRYVAAVLRQQVSCGRKQCRWKTGVEVGERRFDFEKAELVLSPFVSR